MASKTRFTTRSAPGSSPWQPLRPPSPGTGRWRSASEYNVDATANLAFTNLDPITEPAAFRLRIIFWRELEQEKASGAGQAADEEAQAKGAGADRKIGSPSSGRSAWRPACAVP